LTVDGIPIPRHHRQFDPFAGNGVRAGDAAVKFEWPAGRDAAGAYLEEVTRLRLLPARFWGVISAVPPLAPAAVPVAGRDFRKMPVAPLHALSSRARRRTAVALPAIVALRVSDL